MAEPLVKWGQGDTEKRIEESDLSPRCKGLAKAIRNGSYERGYLGKMRLCVVVERLGKMLHAERL